MGKRIYFQSWGKRGKVIVPQFVIQQDWESKAHAIARAIASKSKLSVVTMNSEGSIIEKGNPVATVYQLTLGHKLNHGYGYSVEGVIWFSVEL